MFARPLFAFFFLLVFPCFAEEPASSLEKKATALQPEGGSHPGAENPPIADASILPHKAYYEIKLAPQKCFSDSDDDIVDVNGHMSIQVLDTGDGWAMEQESTLIAYDSTGEGEQTSTTILSWESKDGRRYRFHIKTVRNGELAEEIEGDAFKAPDGKSCIVNYVNPENLSLSLPGNVLFPINHLVHSVHAAKEHRSILSDVVFDGNSETHQAVDVNTTISETHKPNLIIENQSGCPFTPHRAWEMNMAVYPIGSKNPEPDYEISQKVMDVGEKSGVFENMVLDYGTFKVQATIKKIELFNKDS